MSYELLALDLDGTLLDPFGALTDAVREAVGEAKRAGLEVVLCTGRRFRTTLPLLRELDLQGKAVVNNGALVKDVTTARTLHHAYLAAPIYPEVLALMREAGAPLVYVDAYLEETDMLTEAEGATHPFQVEYLGDHGQHCRTVPDLSAAGRYDIIMLSMMADEATLLPLRERARESFGDRVASHLIFNKNYEGLILELFSPASGKWQALRRVAAEAGIAPNRIAAVGDDVNDLGLLRGADLGIAMGNAHEEVKAAADLVVASNAEGGVVEAIHRVLLEP